MSHHELASTCCLHVARPGTCRFLPNKIKSKHVRLFLLFAIGAVLPSASSLDEVTESSASMHGMSMEFCSDSSGEAGLESTTNQPTDQLERFEFYSVNRTHFHLQWRASPQLCGKNVTSYLVDVVSSSPIVNLALGWFGSFPQSTCDPDSKSNNKIKTQNGTVPNACSPYSLRCNKRRRTSTVALPASLWPLVRFANLQFRIRSVGTLARRVEGEEKEEVAACQQTEDAELPSEHGEAGGPGGGGGEEEAGEGEDHGGEGEEKKRRGGAPAKTCGGEGAEEEEEEEDADADDEDDDDGRTVMYSTTELKPVVFHCIVFKRRS